MPHVITNCTDSPRGLTLSRGQMLLGPREIRSLSAGDYAEITRLFRTETFQRLADSGVFRLSGLDDDEASTRVGTPEAPSSLSEDIPVPALARPVGLLTPPTII